MDKFKIKMGSKLDKTGRRYYFALVKLPVQLDLRDTVVHFFPDRNMESGELVVRYYTPGASSNSDDEDNG